MDNQNITNSIINSLNTLFSNLHNSLNADLFKILDEITFIGPNILKHKYFTNLITDKGNGIVLIANAFLFAILIYYSANYLFSRFSVSKPVQSPLQFFSKFVICAILINYSNFICEQILNIFEIVTSCIRTIGFSFFTRELSFVEFSKELETTFLIESNKIINFFTFDGILNTFIYYGFINLLFTYSLRYIFINIFILLFPFAILCCCLDSTQWVFKMWLKNFISLLFIQIVISIIMLLIMSLKYSFSDATVKILYIGSLVALMKTNSFIREFFSGFSTDISNGFSSMRNYFG